GGVAAARQNEGLRTAAGIDRAPLAAGHGFRGERDRLVETAPVDLQIDSEHVDAAALLRIPVAEAQSVVHPVLGGRRVSPVAERSGGAGGGSGEGAHRRPAALL